MANTQRAKIRDPYTGQLREICVIDLDEIRFSGGYRDGGMEQKVWGGSAPFRTLRWGDNWQSKHHDPVYALGYRYGVRDQVAGIYKGDSRDAWGEAVKDGLVNGEEGHCSEYRRES